MVRLLLVPLLASITGTVISGSVLAQDRSPASSANSFRIDALFTEGQIQTACGVSRQGRSIHAMLSPGMLDLNSDRIRILIAGGNEGGRSSARQVMAAWNWFHTDPAATRFRDNFELGVVPVANPDEASASTRASWPQGFPPAGTAYSDGTNAERHYLWRWIGMLAPDVVVIVRPGEALSWRVPKALREADRFEHVATDEIPDENSLATALTSGKPCNVAAIPAVEVQVPDNAAFLSSLLARASAIRSDARKELLRRQNRTPLEVAKELARVYGHNLNTVAYIPALALIGRIRLSELTDDASHLQDVLRIVEPYVSGEKKTLGKRVGGSNLSGHLIFGELARKTGDRRFVALAQAVADLGFDENGRPRDSMPYHNEMSDAVFMGTPILVQTGALTGDSKYHDMAARHLKFMLRLNLRKDGLHQHAPLDPEHTAWGRGNGFPALGLALCLSDLPEDSPHRPHMLSAFRAHLTAMLPHQDEMGMWHQIVDRPESYRELTVTCMTTFAIVRGLRKGWLDRKTFEPAVRRAWQSIKCRVAHDGQLVDVCTGTGKQKSRRAYYDRPAILGRDDRGGAMALLVSTELALAEHDNVIRLTQ